MLANPGAVVYGTVTVGAVLATESAQRETYASTLEGVLVALVLYWLAHSYAEFTHRRAQSAEPVTLAALVATTMHELAILVGAAFPLLALLVGWVLGASLAAAVSGAIWTSAGMIVVIELGLSVRERLPKREFLVQTLFGIVLGVLVIALRVLMH